MYKFLVFALLLSSCTPGVQKTKPTIESISESVYASGIVKSNDQYEAYATVNGIIDRIYVSEGDYIKKGSPILSISNETQRLNKENAALTAAFSDIGANKEKLNQAKSVSEFSYDKMKNDSLMYLRQRNLWAQHIGTKVELEQKELAFQNSKTTYYSTLVNYDDLKRQLNLNSSQAKKNLLISSKQERDYIVRSEIDGIVYSLTKTKGELVTSQAPLAIIGDAKKFTLEMQVDEYDILKVRKGLMVEVVLDSYPGKVFEARVTKIDPLMNERTKTLAVEAEFLKPPEILYPNTSFEASIVLRTKDKALLIPRNFILHDSIVVKSNGDTVVVKTGLKDYQKAEILSGITAEDELIEPRP